MQKQYGTFTKESDGRLSGHVITVNSVRKDGKYTVTHIFGSGKRIGKIYTKEQLDEQISKISE
jgi:hypothetical protein